MNDRELLELAAKAAGLNIKAERVDSDDAFMCFVVGRKGTREKVDWNPLTDDGDALRLAVKVGMNTALIRGVMSIATCFDEDGNPLADAQEPHWADPCAATRRAIVRAAAEIGSGMAAQTSGEGLPEDNYYKTQAEAFYGGDR